MIRSRFVFAFIFCVATACEPAHAGGRKAIVVAPAPSPTPVVLASPAPNAFVTLGDDVGATVNVATVKSALALMNATYANGCLRAGIENHRFVSLNSVFTPGVSTSAQAAKTYLEGAPYAINPRWYYKGWPSKVIGYTYNYRDDDWNGPSETRIWSNTRFITSAEMLASHYSHELSHQARAGGFVHYTLFDGSFPYDVGDIMAKCLADL